MPHPPSRIEDETTQLVEATIELLWAHRHDVLNGRVASDRAHAYVGLVKSACEALPLSAKDLARLSAVCEATHLAAASASAAASVSECEV